MSTRKQVNLTTCRKSAPAAAQNLPQVVKDLFRLGREVACAYEEAVFIQSDLTRNVNGAPTDCRHGMGVARRYRHTVWN